MKSILFFLIPIALLSCRTYSDEDKAHFDKEIEAYIKSKGLKGLERSESGLYYRIDDEGSERKILFKDQVHFKYKGTLTNGKVFDDQTKEGQTFYVQELIGAWKEIMLEIGEGGKAFIIAPPQLGYGNHQLDKIPQNSILVYELEIVEVI